MKLILKSIDLLLIANMRPMNEILLKWHFRHRKMFPFHVKVVFILILFSILPSTLTECDRKHLPPSGSANATFKSGIEVKIGMSKDEWESLEFYFGKDGHRSYGMKFEDGTNRVFLKVFDQKNLTLESHYFELDITQEAVLRFAFERDEKGWILTAKLSGHARQVRLKSMILDLLDDITVLSKFSEDRYVQFCYAETSNGTCPVCKDVSCPEPTSPTMTPCPEPTTCPTMTPCPEPITCPTMTPCPEPTTCPTVTPCPEPTTRPTVTPCPETTFPVVKPCPETTTRPIMTPCPEATSPVVTPCSETTAFPDIIETSEPSEVTNPKTCDEDNKTKSLLYLAIGILLALFFASVLVGIVACKYKLVVEDFTHQQPRGELLSSYRNKDQISFPSANDQSTQSQPQVHVASRESLQDHVYEDPYTLFYEKGQSAQHHDTTSNIPHFNKETFHETPTTGKLLIHNEQDVHLANKRPKTTEEAMPYSTLQYISVVNPESPYTFQQTSE